MKNFEMVNYFSYLLKKFLIFFVFFSFFLINIYCSKDPCLSVSEKIELVTKSNFVSSSEFDNLFEHVQKLNKCKIPAADKCELQNFISSKNPKLTFERVVCNDTLPTLRVFIENSDSMDGYLRGSNDFKDSITNLLVRLKTVSGRMDFNYIHSEIIPVKKNLEGFIKEINLNGNSSYIKNKSNTFGSDLNSIFNRILNNIDNNEISIFITDGIYSIQEANNIQTELFNSQNLTMNSFIEAIQNKSISTVVLQYEAFFDGNYYDMKHIPHQIKSKKPFYIFLFGTKSTIERIWKGKAEEIKKNSKLKNFIFFNKESSIQIPFILLSNYNKKGSKKINDRLRGIIGSIKTNENGIFRFSIVTDLSQLKGLENITENSINYKTNPMCEIQIENFDEILLDSNDKIFMKKFQSIPSHIFTIECDKKIENSDKILISLLKNNSGWIKSASLNNDLLPSSWSEFKTFGIENLISGISEAYQQFNSSDTYFTLQITIER